MRYVLRLYNYNTFLFLALCLGTSACLKGELSWNGSLDSGGSVGSSTPSIVIGTPSENSYMNASQAGNVYYSGSCNQEGRLVYISGDITTTTPCTGGTWGIFLSFSGVADGSTTITATLSNSEAVSASDTRHQIKDTAAPTAPSVIINSGATYTTSTAVGLTLSAGAATEMYVTNTAGCGSGGSWQAYSGTLAWVLGTSNSSATVYVKYRDLAGNETGCNTDVIIHDDTPPTWGNSVSHATSFSSLSDSPVITWTNDASDTNGILRYEYAIGTSAGGADVINWTGQASTSFQQTGMSLTNINTYFVSMRAFDNAGNVSAINTYVPGWKIPLSVLPLYPLAGANWNDYVKNDGPNPYQATDTACNPADPGYYSSCIHGGEKKKVVVNGAGSCSGLSLVDNLDAFEWKCLMLGGVPTFVSRGLKAGKGLRNLLTATPSWAFNHVILSGSASNSSPSSAAWWTNSVSNLIDNSGMSVPFNLNGTNTVYVATVSRMTAGYNFATDKLSLVTLPGVTLSRNSLNFSNCNNATGESTAPNSHCILAAGTQNFLWIEADIEGYGGTFTAYHNILFFNVKHTVIRNSIVRNSQTSNIVFKSSRKNLIYNSRIMNSQVPATIGNGLHLASTSDYNTVHKLFTSTYDWHGVIIDSSSFNRLSKITGFNNNNSVHFDGASGGQNTIVGVMAGSNYRGIMVGSGSSNSQNTVSHVSAINNEATSIDLSGGNNHTLSQLLSMNTAWAVRLSFSNSNIISNLAVDHGAPSGTLIESGSSSNNSFKHNFLLAPGVSGCNITGGTNVGIDTSCNLTGLSTGTRRAAVNDFNSTFFGKVTTDDTKNASDANGFSLKTSITDWTGFDNPFRGWGRDHADTFPSNSLTLHSGTCYGVTNCRIWDWRILASDAVLRNMSGDGNVANQPFIAGSACPLAVDGNYTITDQQTVPQTYLVNAMEIFEDDKGDDDGLCESNEACVYSPNFGAYQGEGPLSAGTCTFSNGVVSGVEMYANTVNGS